jgi:hypothetical protein
MSLRIAAALLVMLTSGRVYADAVARCEDAFIFNEARVNVVVLPYENGIPGREDLTKAGQALSLLVQMNTLARIMQYGSVAAIDLMRASPDDPWCQPDRVWGELIGRSRAHGNGLVLVWGRIFKDGSQIYEQTFIRFARGGIPQEEWTFTLDGHSFTGALSSQATAFPTQTFSEEELQRVAGIIAQNAVIRSEPRDDAPGKPIGPDLAKCLGCFVPDRPASYVITEQRGPWVHLRNKLGDDGWLKVSTGFDSLPLAKKMPEMYFIVGTVSFLQLRMSDDKEPVQGVEEALALYQDATQGATPVGAQTLAAEMRALVKNSFAVRLLTSAVEASPADAEARNLLALAKLMAGVSVSQSKLARDFVAAAVLDPSGKRALSNLKQLLELPQSEKLSEPLSDADRKSQLDLVTAILAKR